MITKDAQMNLFDFINKLKPLIAGTYITIAYARDTRCLNAEFDIEKNNFTVETCKLLGNCFEVNILNSLDKFFATLLGNGL